MRKLASIQRIVDIKPIEGADAIDVATVLGWNVVVKKGEFNIGDLVVYFEIDSLLPIKPEFEFLLKGSKPKKMLEDGKEIEGIRLKTVKLRGQISQGLVLPLSIFEMAERITLNEGDDVTLALNVHKYEIPVPAQLAGKVRGNFPGFLPKTDEPRLQAYPILLERYVDIPFFVTEKVDGSSTTFAIKNGEFHVCSRNLDLLDDGENSIWKVAKELKIEEKMREQGLEEKIALQGEIVGPGIQKNTLKLSKTTILFFNAYNFAEGKFLDYTEYLLLFRSLGLETVPLVTPDFKLLPTVNEMVEFATRKSLKTPDSKLEGLVFRPLVEKQDYDIGRVSFKVINPEYLLKNDD